MSEFSGKFDGKTKTNRKTTKSRARTAQTKTRLRRVEKKVNKLYKEVELKHFDITTAGTAFDNTNDANIICLSSMGQGDTEILRNGLKISPVRLEVHVGLNNPDLALSACTRLIVLRDLEDKQEVGSPVLTDVLEDTTTAPIVKTLSPYKWVQKKRFMILSDKRIVLGVNTSSTTRYNVNLVGSGKSINYNIYFDGPNSTDNSFNHLWLIIINDAVAGHDTEYWWYTRLIYRDM